MARALTNLGTYMKPVYPTGKMSRWCIVLPESFIFALDKAAKRRASKDKPGKRMSRSELIRRILHQFIKAEADKLALEIEGKKDV